MAESLERLGTFEKLAVLSCPSAVLTPVRAWLSAPQSVEQTVWPALALVFQFQQHELTG